MLTDIQKNEKINIAIFASGAGSNARAILKHFKHHSRIKVTLIVTNKSDAGVIKVAEDFNVEVAVISNTILKDESQMKVILGEHRISFIVLAGFLLLIPAYLIHLFPKRIVNIHPALLPNFGGKGMYGQFVHEAVKNTGASETGITIHFCNEHYDEGDIVIQARCNIDESDSVEDIARKVHALEHQYYAKQIEIIVMNNKMKE